MKRILLAIFAIVGALWVAPAGAQIWVKGQYTRRQSQRADLRHGWSTNGDGSVWEQSRRQWAVSD